MLRRTSRFVSRRSRSAAIVQSQTETQVILVRPKTKINHLLHFFITLFTLGFWVFGWIFVALVKKRTKSVILHVNPDGSIVEQSV